MKKTKKVVSEYAAVSGTSLESFTNTVNRYIEEGWELHGSMKYYVTPDRVQWFAQAFVKKTEEDTRGAWG